MVGDFWRKTVRKGLWGGDNCFSCNLNEAQPLGNSDEGNGTDVASPGLLKDCPHCPFCQLLIRLNSHVQVRFPDRTVCFSSLSSYKSFFIFFDKTLNLPFKCVNCIQNVWVICWQLWLYFLPFHLLGWPLCRWNSHTGLDYFGSTDQLMQTGHLLPRET